MKLTKIETGNLMLDAGAMFGTVPKAMWSKIIEVGDDNLANLCMRCLLIEEGDRKILIDTGIGDKQDEKFFKYLYLNGEDSLDASLGNAGVNHEEITDVVFTHLHFDHCGGAVRWNADKTELELSFPNATHWLSGQHWEHAKERNPREKASFKEENYMPIFEQGKFQFFDSNFELIPGVELRIYNGHTIGQVIPFIAYAGKTLVYTADFLPSAAHVPLAWVCGYDVQPLETLIEKKAFFNEAIANNYTLLFEHDIDNECITLKQTEKGIQVAETFSFSDFVGSV